MKNLNSLLNKDSNGIVLLTSIIYNKVLYPNNNNIYSNNSNNNSNKFKNHNLKWSSYNKSP